MKIKHKVVKEFQYLSPDKKIFILKIGTILEEYNYRVKTEIIPIDKDIIDHNPDFFEVIDWRAELLSYMRSEKMPQPAQLGKKLIPFIEDMILSSMSQNAPQQNGNYVDDFQIRELERKEKDLNNRESRIRDKEDEIDIRIKRIEKREDEYKSELRNLDQKEDDLRSRSRGLTERELDLQDKVRELNEKERNLDRSMLESAKDLDVKYVELQDKIDKDLKTLSEKEIELESLKKELKQKEDSITQKEAELEDRLRDHVMNSEDYKMHESELKKLASEIRDWEGLHWKLKRTTKPPSALDEE
jgi:myosin heavy subunit